MRFTPVPRTQRLRLRDRFPHHFPRRDLEMDPEVDEPFTLRLLTVGFRIRRGRLNNGWFKVIEVNSRGT
jgi:hypothetical protein